ncbi:MAG: TonB-dependent siderophore receptor [Pseudomonadota bacterium]
MRNLFLITSALAAVCTNVQAQTSEEPEDTIVVTGQLTSFGALKSATPIVETARSISIETEDLFRDKGALTLDDALNYSAGVVGDTFGFSTRGDFPQVRGFDAAEYRDGQQVLFGFYNNTRSDIYMLEQVEVLKGPASVLFGKGAPGGIVNAVSKVAGPDKGSEVLVDIGNFNRYQAAADLNGELAENLYFRLVALYRDADTQVDFVEDDALIFMPSLTFDNGVTRLTGMVEIADRDGDSAHQFLPNTGTACPSGDVSVTPAILCAGSTGQEIDPSTYHGNPEFNRFNTSSTLVSLLASHQFTDQFSVDGIFRYKDGEADYRQAWIAFTGDGTPRISPTGDGPQTYFRGDRTSEQTALDVRARYEFDTGAINHELFGGFAIQTVETTDLGLFLPGAFSGVVLNAFDPVYSAPPAFALDDDNLADFGSFEADDLGFYLNDQVTIGDLKLNFGVRWDQVETTTAAGSAEDDATSISVGALYALPFGLSPYVSYAESFQPVVGTDGIAGGPLKPQEGDQVEVGVKFQPAGTQTFITAAYFEIEQSNLIDPQATPASTSRQQQGTANVEGFEIEAQTRLGDVYLEGNFSTLDTENVNGVPIDSIPETQGSAWVQYQPSTGPLAGFRFGAGVRALGENQSNFVAPTGDVLATIVTDGVVLGDLLVGYENEGWDFSVNARNITNEEYFGTCLARGDCFPGEQRTVVFRAVRKF